MVNNHKRLVDFLDPNDKARPLFDEKEIDKCIFIDDQYVAIHDKDHLILSKKFLKYSENCVRAPLLKRKGWNNF